MRKTRQLKNLLESTNTEYILDAHNGLSAKIVQEAGFHGIWASGLAISSSLGLRDSNEASWTQVLEIAETMCDATDVPVLLDGDTGFGNFNNVRRLISKLEQRGVAGVCIEDKLFPKTNSFIGGERQPLAEISEFCGKLAAAKDTQNDSDFVVVARIEAFIAGWGLQEALARAHAYSAAGADALLIHSKESTIEQIENFMKHWDEPCPIVLVPTTYSQTPPEKFEELGISLVLWANHLLRSAITSMQENARHIFQAKTVRTIEPGIVSVSEVFRLQNDEELRVAEKRYLPQTNTVKAIILAASRGQEFGPLTADRPKTMIELEGKPLFQRIHTSLNNCGVKDITAVLGYFHNAVQVDNVKKIIHEDWENTGNLYTLYKAIDEISGPTIISYGDIAFEDQVLKNLIDAPGEIVLAVDTSWANSPAERPYICRVIGAETASEFFGSETTTPLRDIGYDVQAEEATGEWVGLIKLGSTGSEIFRRYLNEFFSTEEPDRKKEDLPGFFRHLLTAGKPVFANYFRGRWLDVDNTQDLERYAAERASTA